MPRTCRAIPHDRGSGKLICRGLLCWIERCVVALFVNLSMANIHPRRANRSRRASASLMYGSVSSLGWAERAAQLFSCLLTPHLLVHIQPPNILQGVSQ